ncbi:putative aminosugar-converting enzyme [Streptomyces griseus subsp. griseus NBRC 13350]|uniref:Aminosugar-converting enzyme n=1 Tax=Streptomyces griseus subsp. griseus (strain JCM 4626 / CBS 651.72 / NBRC 13350 / KCC S-0626 / ISP 5235) TaxID=455632 RepID=B1W367_STRGG|nr:putative aminosugar-converting enzyme [Streptomyces griseus subsp. griseus NBRC 13350]
MNRHRVAREEGRAVIRTLFVDAGGVLYNNINEETDFLDRVADRYGVDRAAFARSVQAAAPGYESGERHVHQVLAGLGANGRRPPVLTPAEARWLDGAYLDSVRAYGESFRVLRELRAERPEMELVLTNNEAEQWDRLKDEAHGHFALFDTVCSSWRTGRVKPALSFFTEALRRCRATAAETLLIDDRVPVLRVGAGLGMLTLHVPAPEVLGDRLARTLRDYALPYVR